MPTVIFRPHDAVTDACELAFPLPFGTPHQRFVGLRVEGTQGLRCQTARNSGQGALVLTLAPGDQPEVHVTFDDVPGAFPQWAFVPTGAAHEMPSSDLVALMSEVAPISLAPADRVLAIVRHVDDRFHYGVRDVGLGDDLDAMPALTCDSHAGTCVDTHSYAVAAFRAAGLPACYISGVFFPEGAAQSEPGHCWLAVQAGDAVQHWDISHHLKYGLGATQPVLNPKPGRRMALGIGRGLVFDGDQGPVTLTRLSGFAVLKGPRAGVKLRTEAVMPDARAAIAAA